MNHRKILLSTLIAVSLGGSYESCQAQGNSTDGEFGDGESKSSRQSHNTQSNQMRDSTVILEKTFQDPTNPQQTRNGVNHINFPMLGREADSEEINEERRVEISGDARQQPFDARQQPLSYNPHQRMQDNEQEELEDGESTKKKAKKNEDPHRIMRSKVWKKKEGKDTEKKQPEEMDSKRNYLTKKKIERERLQTSQTFQSSVFPPSSQQQPLQSGETGLSMLLDRRMNLEESQINSRFITPFNSSEQQPVQNRLLSDGRWLNEFQGTSSQQQQQQNPVLQFLQQQAQRQNQQNQNQKLKPLGFSPFFGGGKK